MYFVLQHIWTTCASMVSINSKTMQSTEDELIPSNLAKNSSASGMDAAVLSIAVDQPKGCDYSLLEKKMLIVFQTILLPALYLALVGAEHIRSLTNFRHLEEVKMRVFWVVVDILDILQLQSSMWETSTHQFPYISAAITYFYCYVLLVILPPISMSEMSKREHDFVPHKMIFYLLASVLFVNVGTTVIRLLFLFHFQFGLASSIFLAKNTLCFGMQVRLAYLLMTI